MALRIAALALGVGAAALTSCGGTTATHTASGSTTLPPSTAGGLPSDTAATGGGAASSVPPGPTTTVPTSTTAPGAPSTTLAPRPPAGTGAYGLVTAGPTCPVERPDQPCPPRAVSAQVEARTANGAAVASTHTDSSGRYALALSPGSYTLVAVTGSTFPRCPPVSVTVTSGNPVRADINCDTGIR